MRTLAVLPVKRFELAKSRLRDALAPEQRRELAHAMAADVLDALGSASGLDGVVVVTNDAAVRAHAASAGAEVLGDPHERGQSDAALIGIAHALDAGYDRVLLVPASSSACTVPSSIAGQSPGTSNTRS